MFKKTFQRKTYETSCQEKTILLKRFTDIWVAPTKIYIKIIFCNIVIP